jgi:peptide-methionine (R)-S-oxide reductase
MKNIILLLIFFLLIGCQSNAQKKQTYPKVNKTNQEWKNQLTSVEYNVLRKAGTERAFSGKYDKFYEKGMYTCKGCNTPLFESEHKYDSGSGWPSFDTAIEKNVGYITDKDLGYVRTEIHCNSCNGHLGHVFNDGPKNTTGKRYCINSVSLSFVVEK